MDAQRDALRGVAAELSRSISKGTTLGLGSGSTVSVLIEELAPLLPRGEVNGVPTSTQIEMVAKKSGIGLVPFAGEVDLVLDGADQVDPRLNLIKGGGGALLREKVLMSGARRSVIVAAEGKFAERLCEKGVKVPVEVLPMARESVKARLSKLGTPQERLLPKGYPFFTENGNIILDTEMEPVSNPREKELEIKSIPGVLEAGIFTFKPITVYRLRRNGTYEKLQSR
jgi:ribose 5-phosphate isomerase A